MSSNRIALTPHDEDELEERMKFRKKPVVIEAFQWTGNERPSDWPAWATKVCLLDGKDLVIDTLEGRMKADLGDWIICGVKGEQYPCKPDIFFATYDPA